MRSDAGQWQVCLTGDSDWFDNAPASSLYNGFPHIGTLLKASRYQNQIIRWLLRPLPGDMSDFWLLTARELSVLKILMQGMSFSEIARYEQRSSKTLHAIATQALRKLGLGTLSDFRLLYTGCGDSRVKRNIRLHARYVGQHSAHRLTQYVQNMVSGILYPEKVIVGKSINSDAISGKVLSGQRKHMSKKDQECYDTAALLLPPTAARTDSLQCRGQNISTALGCRSGRHAVQPVQRAGVLTSVREGCVSFFSVPQELYLHSLKLYQPVLSAILPASEPEEELRNKLRHRPQSVVISAGRPAECAEMWFRFYRDHSFVVVLCVAPFFLPPDVSISGVLKNLRLLKTGMSVERAISVANASGGFSGLKHAENLPVMDSYSVFMNEVNNRTKTIVMSERFPEKQRRCCRCFLLDTAGNTVRSFSKRG